MGFKNSLFTFPVVIVIVKLRSSNETEKKGGAADGNGIRPITMDEDHGWADLSIEVIYLE